MDFLKFFSLSFLLFFCSCSHEYVKPENYQHPQISIDTEFGSIVAELYEEKVPNTVSNFITLTESGFYQDMLFHVIVKGAFVQGGCPNTKIDAKGKPGTGGPGYSIMEETREDLSHDSRGILSMAKGRAQGTTGSQFLILFNKLPMLDKHQTVFGKVIKGMEVLELIEKMGARDGRPKREISFSIKVLRKNDIDYHVEKVDK